VDPKAPVETGVPADPKEAKFKLAGEETGASKKAAAKKKSGDKAEGDAGKVAAAAASAAAAAPAVSKAAKGGMAPAEKRKLPSPAVLAGIAAALVAIVGVGAFTLRGGSSQSNAAGTELASTAIDNSGATIAALGSATDANAVANEAENGAEAAEPPGEQPNAAEALRSEKAKAAAAEAQLAAMKRAAAKSAAQAANGASAATRKADRKSAATTAQAPSSASDAGGVSPAKLSQFYSIVDDARSMAKKVMRSGNSQNKALARSYDSNLKTLRDSIRGISSDKEADRLIKQANQTRAYVQFLAQQ
jgi:hypothetical protein